MSSGRLAAFRKSSLAVHRDGLTSWDGPLDPTPSPKVPYPRTYIPLVRILHQWVPFDILLWLSKLKSKIMPATKPRPTVLSSKRIILNLIISFIIGISIGLLLRLDTSQSVAMVKEKLPLGIAAKVEQNEDKLNAVKSFDAPQEEIQLIQKTRSGQQEFAGQPPVEQTEKISRKDIPSIKAVAETAVDIVIRKLVIIITTTFGQPFQSYHLSRLGHMLRAAPPPLVWIVVEWPVRSNETAELLRSSGVMFRHLTCKQNLTSERKIIIRQKNAALLYIKKLQLDGIVHFADEDALYSPDLFEEMHDIRRFGAWPVALHTDIKNGPMLEGPICKNGKVIRWLSNKRNSRQFPIPFSGFAFNSTILWDPSRWQIRTRKPIVLHTGTRYGTQESRFIEKLVDNESQMEGLGGNCSRIMAWNFNLGAPRDWFSERQLGTVLPLAKT